MNRAATIALAPLSGLYGLTMKIRQALYRQGIVGTHDLGAPVVSIGNLTLGGTGKTPLVESIARQLTRKHRRVCVLTRGYQRTNETDRVVVSDGKRILSTPELAGDEAFLLAERLINEGAVISEADRLSAAQWALSNLQSDCFVLDDGFQNLRIARNLNLVTIDASNPWGNGWLLPAGILREPPAELKRADCIVITRAVPGTQLEQLKREIAGFTDNPILVSQTKLSNVRAARTGLTQGTEVPINEIGKHPVAAFCGIGNPQAFFSDLRAHGYNVVHTQVFRDHYRYRQIDAHRLSQESIMNGAKVLLTTAKDEVKLSALRFSLPCYVADISIEFADDFVLDHMIDKVLSEPAARS